MVSSSPGFPASPSPRAGLQARQFSSVGQDLAFGVGLPACFPLTASSEKLLSLSFPSYKTEMGKSGYVIQLLRTLSGMVHTGRHTALTFGTCLMSGGLVERCRCHRRCHHFRVTEQHSRDLQSCGRRPMAGPRLLLCLQPHGDVLSHVWGMFPRHFSLLICELFGGRLVAPRGAWQKAGTPPVSGLEAPDTHLLPRTCAWWDC